MILQKQKLNTTKLWTGIMGSRIVSVFRARILEFSIVSILNCLWGSELRNLKISSLALLSEHLSLHLSHLLNQGTDSCRVRAGHFWS